MSFEVLEKFHETSQPKQSVFQRRRNREFPEYNSGAVQLQSTV